MKKKLLAAIGSGLALAFLAVLAISAQPILETEPNNTAVQADALGSGEVIQGSIEPVDDVDYYEIPGVNTGWGFVALADSASSTASPDIVLTAYQSDGVTVLQSSAGSWERGAGIAFQNYASGNDNHYLRVSELGDNAEISEYNLRYYSTYIFPENEVEPNEARPNATPSSFTMQGQLSTEGDRDCFGFHGKAGAEIALAVDPIGDTFDARLELIGPDNLVLESANVSGLGGSEFILQGDLPTEGLYAYCVSRSSGVTGPEAAYLAGIVTRGGLYFPPYDADVRWLNPDSSGTARVGETLTFQLAITNTSLIEIPGLVRFGAYYDSTCLEFQNAVPAPIQANQGSLIWTAAPDGLSPGEVSTILLYMTGLKRCKDELRGWYNLQYYVTTGAKYAPYFISVPVYLPLVVGDTP